MTQTCRLERQGRRFLAGADTAPQSLNQVFQTCEFGANSHGRRRRPRLHIVGFAPAILPPGSWRNPLNRELPPTGRPQHRGQDQRRREGLRCAVREQVAKAAAKITDDPRHAARLLRLCAPSTGSICVPQTRCSRPHHRAPVAAGHRGNSGGGWQMRLTWLPSSGPVPPSRTASSFNALTTKINKEVMNQPPETGQSTGLDYSSSVPLVELATLQPKRCPDVLALVSLER
jgi:hypothetical protein